MSTTGEQHTLNVCRASAGTGKTYTLAAYYIALLLSGESFRNILAVTFTNAATAEMKERILTYLLRLADGGEQEFLGRVREFMLRDSDAPDGLLRERAEAAMHAILQDYDNFSVTTIDSFLQQLIRSMAQAIGRTADFAISLDAVQVITAAVDQMLTTGLTDDSRRTVYEYVEQCIGDSRSWDIRQNLIRIAMQLYRESVQVHRSLLSADGGQGLELNEQRIADYRNALYAQRNAALARFRTRLTDSTAAMDSGNLKATVKNALENMRKSLDAPEKMSKDDLFRGATDRGMCDMLSDPQTADLQHACDEMRHTWWQCTCSLTYLNDMRLMSALEDCIRRSLITSNTALLADTAVTLAEALRPGDADFILEKAGIRYRHIMIDEFQDTSLLQWSVFLHLIREILAVPGQTVLIVGDTKQSIYRFRNGNWQIMEGLGRTQLQEAFNPDMQPLVRNQRSRRNVVAFNIGVMQQVTAQDNLKMHVSPSDNRPVGQALYGEKPRPIEDYYRTDKHEGGFVRCRFYPYIDKRSAAKLGADNLLKEVQQQALWEDVCLTIEQLLNAGERPQDILVLARRNDEIQQWVTFCREQGERFPTLNRTQMVSRDSFRLESCTTVLLLIDALRYLHTGSASSAEFIRLQRGDEVLASLDAIDRQAPLYDQLQHALQCIGCEQGIYRGTDIAYVNSLLDQVQAFIATNGSDVNALLQYWDDKLHLAAIAADSSSRAIRLMSVHSSKGLEGKTVILLDAAWKTENDRPDDVLWTQSVPVAERSLPLIPVRQDTNLRRTGEQSHYYAAYRREHEAQRIDCYNLLYVALTRAADNLYVYALPELRAHTDGYPTAAASLLDCCHLRDDLCALTDSGQTLLEYSLGTPFIHPSDEQKAAGTFDYTAATPLPVTLYSDGTQVTFRQSQESTRYTLDPAGADSATAQVDFGLLCHDIFSHIERAEDVVPVLDDYRRQGLIDSPELYQRIAELIRRAFASPEMQQWFDGSWQLMREAAILTPHTLIRPDRVMIRGDRAVVLDYKFAAEHRPGYILQVRDYMSALMDMGYTRVEGWLWYAFTNQLVRVNE